MTMSKYHDRKRGRMTDDDRQEIERLCATMKNPTPGKIARLVSRHPATINWYMLTHGLIERAPGRATRPYQRKNGRMVYPYAPQHDVRLTELRKQNLTYARIAEIITSEFGIERDSHSVQVRIVQLSAAPDDCG